MTPTDQGLGAKHGTAAQIDLGLVVQNKLVALQGQAQHVQVLAVQLGFAVTLGVKQVVAVFARFFGGVHRLVGMAQQGIGIGMVLGVQAHPNAGGHAEPLAV